MNRIEMQKTMSSYFDYGEDVIDTSPNEVIKKLKKAEWKKEPYKYQNWGNWLHRMSAYVGKIKPAMAYSIIKAASNERDVVLDPFCGIGTIPLECDLLDRIGIGVDLNPYAYLITKAKFDRTGLEENLLWLDSLKINTEKIDLSQYSKYMKKFYHPDTLKEILVLQRLLLKNEKYFLYGCLLGIIHGHRPGHLSAVTSLVIPYDPRVNPEYKEVIPRVKEKVKRMYRDGFKIKTRSRAYHADARKLPLKRNSVDLVISSPPYYNTLDYVNDNRLRLEFMGLNNEDKNELKTKLIQDKSSYVNEMIKVGKSIHRVIKPDGLCIFVLGDLHVGKNVINTAEEIRKVYEKLGFVCYDIIDDAMPSNKCIPSNIKRNKLDRIMVMSVEK